MARAKRTSLAQSTGSQSRMASKPKGVKPSKRYTPPIPMSQRRSGKWLAVLLFALLGLGFVVIFVNYLGVMPGGASNWYLLGGLALLAGGFFIATKYH